MKSEVLEKAFKEDFTLFADVIFRSTLELGPLTKVQRNICGVLQENKDPRLFLSCFRNLGKSYILALFSIWKLYNDPNEKILVISATYPRAKDFVRFCKDVMTKTPILSNMAEVRGSKNRSSINEFDIVGAKTSQFASLKAVGITGQLTGSRATTVIFDDVEIVSNSQTEASRAKLTDAVREANALLLPKGFIYIIGTPQSRFSIYNDLDGFKTIKYPIYYPHWGYQNLAPYLDKLRQENPELIGEITDPERFTKEDIEARKVSYGASLFQLQYQLDTTLTDADRFPLKTTDCRVTPVDDDRYYIEYQDVGKNDYKQVEYTDLRPTSTYLVKYENKILAVDPCSRGLDEFVAVCMFVGGGRIFIKDAYYRKDGLSNETMRGLIDFANHHGVKNVIAEQNYGGGLWSKLLTKHIMESEKDLGITVEDTFSRGKKADRIIASCEPFLNSGKLVFDTDYFQKELSNPQYNLFQQMQTVEPAHIWSKYDDRVDALSIGLAYLSQNLAISESVVKMKYEEDLFEQELDSIINSPIWVKTGRTKYNSGSTFGNALQKRR